MRRLIPVALFLLVVPLLWAQIHGVPPSVTSLRPGFPISTAPPASVTSLGPFGWQVPPNFRFVPGMRFHNPRFFNGQFFDGDFDADDFVRFRRRGFFGGPFFGGGPFVPSAVVPVFVPYDNPVPMPVAMYPMASYGGVQPGASTPIEVHVTQEAAPSPAPAAATVPAPPEPEQEPTVLVFRDGHRLQIRNYAIVGNEIVNFSGSGPRRIALADLDLDATRKLNDDRGVEFRLPTRAVGS